MGIIQNMEAQFMLLAGFIIAIGLVITTVLLNSIIFEGNMAIDGGSELSKDEIVNMLQITRDEVRSAYSNSTALGGTRDNAITNFTRQLNNFSGNLARVFAIHGEGVNLNWDIENWNSSIYANFTENGMPAGTADWTVIDGVNDSSVDIFRFWNVTMFDPGFKIEARNSTGFLWSAEFNTSGSMVTNTTNTSYGPPPGADIDLISQYYFKQSLLFQTVSIHIINGANAYGKFKIQGISNGRTFYRERHYILNATSIFSTSKLKVNMTIPVSVPW